MKSQYVLLLLLVNVVLQVKTQPNATYDSKYFDKLSWSNIGSILTGELPPLNQKLNLNK